MFTPAVGTESEAGPSRPRIAHGGSDAAELPSSISTPPPPEHSDDMTDLHLSEVRACFALFNLPLDGGGGSWMFSTCPYRQVSMNDRRAADAAKAAAASAYASDLPAEILAVLADPSAAGSLFYLGGGVVLL